MARPSPAASRGALALRPQPFQLFGLRQQGGFDFGQPFRRVFLLLGRQPRIDELRLHGSDLCRKRLPPGLQICALSFPAPSSTCCLRVFSATSASRSACRAVGGVWLFGSAACPLTMPLSASEITEKKVILFTSHLLACLDRSYCERIYHLFCVRSLRRT
jgi:hypothetical protein